MELNIIVCMKAVMIKAPSGREIRSSDTCGLNPFDRVAMEAALRLKEACGGRLTALSLGPVSTGFVLCEALAMGFDRGVLVSDRALAGSDTIATSRALAAALRRLNPFDLLFFGMRSADSDTGQVGPQTAVMLGLPLVTGVRALAVEGDGLRVDHAVDGFLETFRLPFPAAATIHPACAKPRDISLAGLQDAFEGRSLGTLALVDLGIAPELVGEAGSPTRLLGVSRAGGRRKCEFVEGDMQAQAQTLARRLAAKGLIA